MPLEPGIHLTPDSPTVLSTLLTPAKKRTYQEMIKSLMYATITMLLQYLDAPHSTHLKVVMRSHYLWPQKLKNCTIPVNLEAIQTSMIATKLF